jgi:hypothetical protein
VLNTQGSIFFLLIRYSGIHVYLKASNIYSLVRFLSCSTDPVQDGALLGIIFRLDSLNDICQSPSLFNTITIKYATFLRAKGRVKNLLELRRYWISSLHRHTHSLSRTAPPLHSTPTPLLLHSYSTPTPLLLHSYSTPTPLHSYSTPTPLLLPHSHSLHSHSHSPSHSLA